MINNFNVIFDLDGTLIDSQDTILRTLSATLQECGFKSAIPLTKDLVGPPLNCMLELVCKGMGVNELRFAAEIFQEKYDKVGYKHSIPYRGISELIYSLNSKGYQLHLATNKRYVPTEKILNHLGWRHFFSEIYSIDGPKNLYENKSQILRDLKESLKLNGRNCVYVGDRSDDYEASLINGLQCILVNWGYEKDFPKNKTFLVVNSVKNLLIEIEKKSCLPC